MTRTTRTTADLTIRAFTPADEPAVLKLLERSLAGGPTGERTAAFLRWKHFDNPFGRSIGLVATDGDELAGVRLVMRWAFDLDGRRVTAGRMVDTATDPAYRGRGIFRDLTTAALEIARGDIDLIFNTPNASSRPGYLSMGWTEVGILPTSVRSVHPLRLARGLRSALARRESVGGRSLPATPLPGVAEVLTADASEVEQLLASRHAPRGRLVTPQSGNYLRWRYADVPGLDYRAVRVHRAGRLTGLGIGRLRRRGPLVEFTLAEVLHAADDVASARQVLVLAATGSGADHVATHVARSNPTRRGLRRAGYLTTRRIGLTLATLPLTTLPIDPTDLDAWALSLGDIEVF